MEEPFVLRAVKPIPSLHLQVDDLVIFDPQAPHLLTRWRPSKGPDVGAALLAFEEGALEADCATPPSSAELRRVVGLTSPVSPSLPSQSPGRHGRRLHRGRAGLGLLR